MSVAPSVEQEVTQCDQRCRNWLSIISKCFPVWSHYHRYFSGRLCLFFLPELGNLQVLSYTEDGLGSSSITVIEDMHSA